MQYTNISDNKIEVDLGHKAYDVKIYFTDGPFGSGKTYCNYESSFDHGDVAKLPLQGKTVTIEAYQLWGDETHGQGILTRDNPDGSEFYACLPSDHSIIIEYAFQRLFLKHRRVIALDWDNTAESPLGVAPLVVVPKELMFCMGA